MKEFPNEVARLLYEIAMSNILIVDHRRCLKEYLIDRKDLRNELRRLRRRQNATNR